MSLLSQGIQKIEFFFSLKRVKGIKMVKQKPWTIIFCFSIFFLSALPLFAKEVIVAIGDSITQADTHWTVEGHKNTIQGGWVTRLESILNENFSDEYDVVNKGINGDTAYGVLNRLNRNVIQLKPDIVIVAIGTITIYLAT